MKVELKNLFKDTVIYGAGTIVSRAITFLLIPFYTIYLSPGDFGIMELCSVINILFVAVYLVGVDTALLKSYYGEENTDSNKLVNTVLTWYLAFGVLVFGIMFLFRYQLATVFFGDPSFSYLFTLVMLSVYFEGFLLILTSLIKIYGKAVVYAVSTVIKVTIYALANIILLKYFHRSYTGIRESTLLHTVCAVIIIAPFVIKKFKFEIDKKMLMIILQLGFPIAFQVIGSWILTLTDRYMIKFLMPESLAMTNVGLYSLGSKISEILRFLVVIPFGFSWSSFMFSYSDKPDAKEVYKLILNAYTAVSSIIFLVLAMFSKEIIALMSPASYSGSSVVIPFLTFTKLCTGFHLIFGLGSLLAGKTKYLAYSTLWAAFTNVVLNFLLIPHWGIVGASVASVLSYLLSVVILYRLSQKCYKVDFEVKKISVYLVAISLLVAGANFLNIGIFLKIVLFFAAFPMIFMFKLLPVSMLRKVKIFVQNKLNLK